MILLRILEREGLYFPDAAMAFYHSKTYRRFCVEIQTFEKP